MERFSPLDSTSSLLNEVSDLVTAVTEFDVLLCSRGLLLVLGLPGYSF